MRRCPDRCEGKAERKEETDDSNTYGLHAQLLREKVTFGLRPARRLMTGGVLQRTTSPPVSASAGACSSAQATNVPVAAHGIGSGLTGSHRLRLERREHGLELSATRLQERGEREMLAQMGQVLVGGETGSVGRDLEEHTAGLAEVDGPEVETVDDRSDTHSGTRQLLLP